MLSDKILVAMRAAGALKVKRVDEDGNLHFDVNYKIVEERFPAYLDDMVKATSNPVDWEFYNQGLMLYTVTPDGQLLWKPSQKWLDFYNDIMGS